MNDDGDDGHRHHKEEPLPLHTAVPIILILSLSGWIAAILLWRYTAAWRELFFTFLHI